MNGQHFLFPPVDYKVRSFVCRDNIFYVVIKSYSEEKVLFYAQFLPGAGIPNLSEISLQYEILPVYN